MKRKLLFDPILNKLTSHPVEPKPEGLVTSVNNIKPNASGNVDVNTENDFSIIINGTRTPEDFFNSFIYQFNQGLGLEKKGRIMSSGNNGGLFLILDPNDPALQSNGKCTIFPDLFEKNGNQIQYLNLGGCNYHAWRSSGNDTYILEFFPHFTTQTREVNEAFKITSGSVFVMQNVFDFDENGVAHESVKLSLRPTTLLCNEYCHQTKNNYITTINGFVPDENGNVTLPLERSGWMEIPSGENVVTFMVKNGPGLYLCNPRSTYTGGLPEGQQFEIARTSYSTFLFITYRLSKMPAYYDYSTTEVYADLWLQMADLTANGYMAMAAWRGVACNEFFLTQANVSWRQVIDYDGEVFIRNDVRLEGNPMVEDLAADFDQLPEYFQNNRIVNKKYVDQKVGNEITNHFLENNYITTINGLVPDESGNVILPLGTEEYTEIPDGQNIMTYMFEKGPGVYICKPYATYTGLPDEPNFENNRNGWWRNTLITYKRGKAPVAPEPDWGGSFEFGDFLLEINDIQPRGYKALASFRRLAYKNFDIEMHVLPWQQLRGYQGEVILASDFAFNGNPTVEDLPENFDQLPIDMREKLVVNKRYVDELIKPLSDFVDDQQVRIFPVSIDDPIKYMNINGPGRYQSGLAGDFLNLIPGMQTTESAILLIDYKNYITDPAATGLGGGYSEFIAQVITGQAESNDNQLWRGVSNGEAIRWSQILDSDGKIVLPPTPLRNEQILLTAQNYSIASLHAAMSAHFSSSDTVVEGVLMGGGRLHIDPSQEPDACQGLGWSSSAPMVDLNLDYACYKLSKNYGGSIRAEVRPVIYDNTTGLYLWGTTFVIENLYFRMDQGGPSTPDIQEITGLVITANVTSMSAPIFTAQ